MAPIFHFGRCSNICYERSDCMEKEKRGNLIVLSLLFLLFRTYVIQKPSFQKSSTCFQFLLPNHTLFSESRSFCRIRSFASLNLTQKMCQKKTLGAYDVLDTVGFFSLCCANLVFLLPEKNASGCCAAGIVRVQKNEQDFIAAAISFFPLSRPVGFVKARIS